MGSEVIIMFIIFAAVFGVFYLYISSRNRERLALIEKGADASIFSQGKRHAAPFWKVFILNLALLLVGIGVGLIFANILDQYTALDEAALVGVVFLCAGGGLYAGFTMTKKLDD